MNPLPMPDPAAIEPELIAAAQRGDVTAFERLYRASAGRIYALCLRMVAEPGWAEELTQDAFVRAWQKLDSFHGTSAWITWLHRLTVNLVIDALRRRRRWRQTFTAEADAGPEPGAPPRDPAHRLDLDRAVATLPPQARTVFVLHEIEGYRHQEIAAMTGIAEGTSKAHLHRARRRLQEILL